MVSFRSSALATACLLLSCLMVARADLDDRQKQDIDRLLQMVQRCTGTPGLTFAIYGTDQTSATRYYAHVGQSDGQRITAKHSFCIGDATQAFSAVLLGMLIDANDTVTWDMPVERIIGTRIQFPDLYRTENLKLKDIFAMRSGVAGMDMVPLTQPYDQRTLISNLRYAPIAAGFREKFIPNDVLFSLVQEATEALGGDTWHNLMRQYILRPLMMDDSFFAGTSMEGLKSGKSIVRGAVKRDGRDVVLSDDTYDGLELIAPAASLCTSADDMFRWFRFLLNGGTVDTEHGPRQIIKKETLDMLYEGIVARGRDGNPVTEGYRQDRQGRQRRMQAGYTRAMNSMGFINGNYKGARFVSQDGSLPGFQTLATILPDSSKAVFVSFRGDQRPKNFAAKVLMNIAGLDIMTRGDSWVKDKNVCDLMNHLENLHDTNPGERLMNVAWSRRPSPRPLKDYEATYRNWALGDAVVKYNESGSEELTLKYGKVTYRLHLTVQNDTFQMLAVSGPLWYSTNADWYKDFKQLYAVFGAQPVRRAAEEEEEGEENNDDDDEEKEEEGGEGDAEAKEEEKRPMDRVVNVTISGFDSRSHPVFAINARRPAYETGRHRDAECSAPARLLNSPAAVISLWAAALLSSLLTLFR